MRPRKYPKVAEALGELISSGSLAPGDQLPSQHEIAARYGISRSCAQRALNLLADRGLVEKRPGRGVFVRNPAARKDLRGALGFLVPATKRTRPDPRDNLEYETLLGIEEAVREKAQRFVLRRHPLDSTFDDLGAIVHGLETDGLVINRDFPDDCIRLLTPLGLPIVVAGRTCHVPGVGSAAPNFYDGYHQLCAALVADGVRHIGLLYPSAHPYAMELVSSIDGIQRMNPGTRIEALDYFPGPDPFDGTRGEQLTKALTNKLIDEDALPEVLVGLSDWTVFRALEVLHERGVPVPGRVGLIGCFGLALCEQVTPQLSTLAVDCIEMGRQAVAVLADMIAGGPSQCRVARIPLKFVERESFRWRHGDPAQAAPAAPSA